MENRRTPIKSVQTPNNDLLSEAIAVVSEDLSRNVTSILKTLLKIRYESWIELDASPEWQKMHELFTRADLVGKWERQIVSGSAFHMYGMQRGIGALHRQFGLLRNQRDVRNVVTVPLVEMSALVGRVQRLPGRDVPEINDGVGNAAVRANDQALKVGGLLGVGIADLRVFRDGKFGQVGNRSRPLYSACYGAPVLTLMT